MLKFDKKGFDKAKLVKNLAQGNVLVPFIDRVFETFDEPWSFDYTEKIPDDAWHPSGDCTPPVTVLYAKAKDHLAKINTRQISGSLRKSFMVGHYWHQLLQYIVLHKLEFCTADAIERHGSTWWSEVTPVLIDPLSDNRHGLVHVGHERTNMAWAKPQPFCWVSGSADIAPLVTSKWTGLVDFKTMSSNQFRQPTIPEWAAAKYTCQMNIYMDLFDLDSALIVAVNKDAPHDLKEFEFVRNDELILAIYRKWHFVSEALRSDTAPTAEDNKRFALPIDNTEERDHVTP